jgi:hypothetical protein
MRRAPALPRVLGRLAAVGGLMALGAWLVVRASRGEAGPELPPGPGPAEPPAR